MSGGNISITNGSIPCLHCGEMFPGRSRTDGKQDKFCSRKCFREHRGIVVKCKTCGKEFPSYDRNSFCSRKCYFATKPVQMVSRTCANCGNDFLRIAAFDLRRNSDSNRKRFCGQSCCHEYNRGERHPMFLGNRSAYRGGDWRAARSMAIAEYGFECRACGCNLDNERSSAHVDHLVPFRYAKRLSSSKSPNAEENLRVLCRPCHTKKTKTEIKYFRLGEEAYVNRLAVVLGERLADDVRQAFEYFAGEAHQDVYSVGNREAVSSNLIASSSLPEAP